MKRTKLNSILVAMLYMAAIALIAACEGPEGPAGKDGADGEDGIDGKDGNATCGVCHDNSETVEIKVLQWGASIHATGGNYERNDVGCAPCHTSQGFKEVVVTGLQETAAKVQDPSNINCYTCHLIHDTYTVDDWALRTTAQVTLWINGEQLPDYGNGNMCMNCHQPRVATIPDVANPEGTYTITSARYGPHHGPQSTVLTGQAFFKIGEGYPGNTHDYVLKGCIDCHMADAFGSQAGGHSFNITYDYHGSLEYNLLGCATAACHGSVEAAEAAMEEFEPEFETLMTELATKLQEAGIYNPEGTSGTAVPGTYTNKVAGAYWNFITLEEDRSMGVHNPKFTKKILENTIASLE